MQELEGCFLGCFGRGTSAGTFVWIFYTAFAKPAKKITKNNTL
jgi:hypothetical protein